MDIIYIFEFLDQKHHTFFTLYIFVYNLIKVDSICSLVVWNSVFTIFQSFSISFKFFQSLPITFNLINFFQSLSMRYQPANLQTSMEPLIKSIALRIKGGCSGGWNPQNRTHSRPNCRCEMWIENLGLMWEMLELQTWRSMLR